MNSRAPWFRTTDQWSVGAWCPMFSLLLEKTGLFFRHQLFELQG